jgi:hypothetical protein
MDPQKCWNDLCRAYDERRCEDVERLVHDLKEWMNDGGPAPSLLGAVTPEMETTFVCWLSDQMLCVVRSGMSAEGA